MEKLIILPRGTHGAAPPSLLLHLALKTLPKHCVGLARTCLAVSKDCAVVAQDDVVDASSYVLEDIRLRGLLRKDALVPGFHVVRHVG